VLDAILRLVHPVMPFVTETVWRSLNEAAFERGLPTPEPAAEAVTIAPWPSFPPTWRDSAMEARVARMQELVRMVREVHNRYQVDPRTPLDVTIRCSAAIADDFRTLAPFITSLASVGKLECGPTVAKTKQSAACVHPDFEAFVSLAGLIDVAEEI